MPTITKICPLTLLHIDDNLDDRLLLQAAIESTAPMFNVQGVGSLQEATAYFPSPQEPIAPAPLPALVLLDHDLGAQRGTDFLYWIRTQQRIKAIPVIMYCGYTSEAVVAECYALGANHFLRKPLSFRRLTSLAYALRACFSQPTPKLQLLNYLPEYIPDPRAIALATP